MSTTAVPTRTDRVLAAVERIGNRLPDPFLLFLGLFLLVGVLSTALQLAGTSVTIPGADEETVVRGLFTGEGMTWLTTNLGANFIGFPPLVTVVTILLAVTVGSIAWAHDANADCGRPWVTGPIVDARAGITLESIDVRMECSRPRGRTPCRLRHTADIGLARILCRVIVVIFFRFEKFD